ncbi:MAG: VanZ family protein, partial [Defluviitaleaceae bacterium]|nr:VanZ family protein [Defluviitaleaceae bacterium]
MKKTSIAFFIWLMLSLFVAGVIFWSSSIDGYGSDGASMGVALFMQRFIPLEADVLNLIVRKGAHLTAYFVLGLCVAGAVRLKIRRRKVAFF